MNILRVRINFANKTTWLENKMSTARPTLRKTLFRKILLIARAFKTKIPASELRVRAFKIRAVRRVSATVEETQALASKVKS